MLWKQAANLLNHTKYFFMTPLQEKESVKKKDLGGRLDSTHENRIRGFMLLARKHAPFVLKYLYSKEFMYWLYL